jgi:hypothetical protein
MKILGPMEPLGESGRFVWLSEAAHDPFFCREIIYTLVFTGHLRHQYLALRRAESRWLETRWRALRIHANTEARDVASAVRILPPHATDRASLGQQSHEPPRRTRLSPDFGPLGSSTGAAVYLPYVYRSEHHCHAFPCMS